MAVPSTKSEYDSTMIAKPNTVQRIARSMFRSLRRTKCVRMLLTKAVDGASIVADAVDITAESTAPKKSTRSQSGMWSRTSVGNRRCGSVASMSCALLGITRMAAMTMNIGTNAKRM